MTDEKESEAEADCVIPPVVPAEEAGRYSTMRDPHAEEDIASYIRGQAPDEEIRHVEKVKTEHVLGDEYEIWDVTTDKDRWWVITNLTNLYSQKTFPSLDYTLSFHIGLMRRIMERNRKQAGEESAPFDEVARRQDQALELLDRAVEAEEFQAVGMQLRECLVSLVNAMQRHVALPAEVPPPKAADFIGWFDVLMNALAPGDSNRELRSYLKGAAKDTWQLVNWLTHARNANRTAATVAVHGCGTVIGHSIHMVMREQTDRAEKCPRCSSRDIRPHFDRTIGEDGAYFSSCGACGWDNHPGTSETPARDS